MIVVDASVAAKWLFSEEFSEEALDLVAAALLAGERIVVPPLLWIEVANIMRQRMRSQGLSLAEVLDLFDRLQEIPMRTQSPPDLSRRALVLADMYGLPATYDAHYIALSDALGCDLWTADHRLYRAVGRKLPDVRWIGDYRKS